MADDKGLRRQRPTPVDRDIPSQIMDYKDVRAQKSEEQIPQELKQQRPKSESDSCQGMNDHQQPRKPMMSSARDDLPAKSDIERDSSEMSASVCSQSGKTHSDDTTSSIAKHNQQHWRSGAVSRVHESARTPKDQPNWRSGAVPRVHESTRMPEDQPNTRNEAVSGTHSRASDDPSVRQRALPLTENNSASTVPRNKVDGSSRMPDDQQNWRSRRLESPLKDLERYSSGQKRLDISERVDDQSNRGRGRGHSGHSGRGGHGWRARGTQASGTSRGFQERCLEQHQIKTVVARIDKDEQQKPHLSLRYAEQANRGQGMEGRFRTRGRHALSTSHEFHSRSVEENQMSAVDGADGEEHQRCPETKYTGRSGQRRGRSRG